MDDTNRSSSFYLRQETLAKLDSLVAFFGRNPTTRTSRSSVVEGAIVDLYQRYIEAFQAEEHAA